MSATITTAMSASDYISVTQQLYLSYFGRPADPLGLKNFSERLAALDAPLTLNGINVAMKGNADLIALMNSFGSSSESVALYGRDTLSFVNAVYVNVLNRQPDFNGLLFWATEIQEGRLEKAAAALAIADGALALGNDDAAVLHNKTIIATNFTKSLDTASEVLSYTGDAAAALIRSIFMTITATTNPDTFDIGWIVDYVINHPVVTFAGVSAPVLAIESGMPAPGHDVGSASIGAGHEGAGLDVTLVGLGQALHDVVGGAGLF